MKCDNINTPFDLQLGYVLPLRGVNTVIDLHEMNSE